VYNGSEEFKSGKYKAEDYIETTHDHNAGEGWGSISYDEGFARSSNVAAARLVWDKLGTDDYLDYLKAFDFDEVTALIYQMKFQAVYDITVESNRLQHLSEKGQQ